MTQNISTQLLQNLLALLQGTNSAEGASLIGLEDVGGNTTETDVEGAINELYGLVGGGGGAFSISETIQSNRTVNSTGVQVIGHSLGVVPNLILVQWGHQDFNAGMGVGSWSSVNIGNGNSGHSLNTGAGTPKARGIPGGFVHTFHTNTGDFFAGSITAATTTDFTVTWTSGGAGAAPSVLLMTYNVLG